MKDLIKNLKHTLAQIFGFENQPEVQEWGEKYINALANEGIFSQEDVRAFDEADKNIGKLLEVYESDSKPKTVRKPIKPEITKDKHQEPIKAEKGIERE